MSSLAQIRAREANFHTCQVTDWLDGLPVIVLPGAGGVVAGASNVGRGSLVVAGVDAGAEIGGTQVAAITAIAGGLTYLTVTDLDGTVTGEGVVGAPLYAGGVSFTLNQVANQPALAVGDTFAVSVLPQPLDISGLIFTLDSRIASGSATFALRATSDPNDPSLSRILNGGPTGTLALQVPQAVMAACPVSPSPYPHNIYATDPVSGLRVTAFYGVIAHQNVLQPNA